MNVNKFYLLFIVLFFLIVIIFLIKNKKFETFLHLNKNVKILYIVRSIPKYYDKRIKSQYDTWFKLLTKNDKLLIASELNNHKNKYNLKYSTPGCPKGHGDGPCCSESNALVKSLKIDFDWVFIVDDDVYLYPNKIREIIHKYKDNHNVAIGTPGCVAANITGFCGGGGYGFSKKCLKKLVGKDPKKFLKKYKKHCDKTQFCDITTADLLVQKNIKLINIPELKPWGIKTNEIDEIHNNKIGSLHYFGGELTKNYKTNLEKMNYLHSLFTSIKESFMKIGIIKKKKKKIIAFTLWGNNKCYNYTALENALHAKKLYPGFICRYYIGRNVIPDVIKKLKKLDNVEIVYINKHKKLSNMFYRFLPMYENDVDILLSRDTYSLINIREKLAVNEWLQSDKNFHIMRDNVQHSTKILGGMFGIKVSKIKLSKQIFDEYLYKSKGIMGEDQNFLQEIIYPKIKDSVMIHDSNHHYKDEKIKSFPKSNYKDFVGNYSCNNYKKINQKYGLNFKSFTRERDTT